MRPIALIELGRPRSEDKVAFIEGPGAVRDDPHLPLSKADQHISTVLFDVEAFKGSDAVRDLDFILALTEIGNRVVAVICAELEYISTPFAVKVPASVASISSGTMPGKMLSSASLHQRRSELQLIYATKPR